MIVDLLWLHNEILYFITRITLSVLVCSYIWRENIRMAPSSNMFARIVAEEINEADVSCVSNAIVLLEAENTIPFIARYRRIQTGGMDAERLRHVKRAHDTLKAARLKAEKIVQKLGSTLSNVKREQILEARTSEEVNELYAPFKKGGKGTLAERARQLGLETPALNLLKQPETPIVIPSFIRSNQEGLRTFAEVRNGIQHVIADVISKDKDTNDAVKTLIRRRANLESTTTEEKAKADKSKKFQLYYNFSSNTERMQSHQILAINRGEEQKVLIVKISFDKNVKISIINWLKKQWIPKSAHGENINILASAVEDSYKRLIEKKYFKRIRARLTAKAEAEAVNVFSRNLKRLLLAAPIRGKNLLAIDPGFTHGCKIAALDKHGQVLETGVIFPFGAQQRVAEKKVVDSIKQHGCNVIGIGNGTACRETEAWIANLIKKELFRPMDVSYCIVNESGASVYSVTKDAEAELPNMDPNLRSAVSIGRRLQDPLLELVKIEPKHLGVGMYQHDISEVLMKGALEGVLEDCVSFVGVDLNASSASILKRIAGLGAKKADAIIAWREKNGPFVNRKQLLLVKGLGKKAFEQCAGFVRVMAQADRETSQNVEVVPDPASTVRKRKATCNQNSTAKKRKTDAEYNFEILDQTWVHPESYDAAYRLLQMVGAPIELTGTRKMAGLLENAKSRLKKFVDTLKIDEETLSIIIKGLQQPLGFDIRSEMQQPSFKKELKSISDLRVGQTISGIVSNVTSFGVFIDCGVGQNGLIHKTCLGGCTDLGPGDKCECSIMSIDENRNRIGLKFKNREHVVPNLR